MPVAVYGGHVFATLSVAIDRACGVTTGGQTYCWGSSFSNVPTLVGGGRTFRTVVLGSGYHAIGVE